jgi:small-conductance mechanosensitive channel
MNSFLQDIYWGNSVSDWLISFVIVIVLVQLVRIVLTKWLVKVQARAEKTAGQLDDFICMQIRKMQPFAYILCIYGGIAYLKLTAKTEKWLHFVFLIIITILALRLITAAIRYFVNNHLKGEEQTVSDSKIRQARGIITIINIIIWFAGIIFLADNLGFNVTSIIAGLGIGGIAVALAAQAILGDLFSYFVIFFDKPFEIGDFIIVDEKMGTIEYIGLKTTRVRTLGGEQLIFSNHDLTSSRIHNYKRMEKRRIAFSLGVEYETSPEKLHRIPGLVRDIIERQNEILFDRGHFASFGDFSLKFEFVYYILSSDYNVFMETQQNINYSIFESFQHHDIAFAYPTTKTFLAGAVSVANGQGTEKT